MQPDADESTVPASEEVEAPPAEEIEATPDLETPETDAPAEPEETISLADAFAAAKAELGTEPPDSDGEKPPASSEPAESVKPTEPVTDETVAGTKTPDEYRREAREQVLLEQSQDKAFRKLFLEHETKRIEDPDAFSEDVIANPAIAQFMQAYRLKNPDVSLESPEGNAADPVRVRASIDAEYQTVIHDMAAFLAKDNGLADGEFQAIKTQAGPKLGVLLQETFNASVKKAAERMRTQIAADERAAVTAELTAKFATSRVLSPRVIGGTPSKNTPASDPDASPLRAAFDEAKLELAKR